MKLKALSPHYWKDKKLSLRKWRLGIFVAALAAACVAVGLAYFLIPTHLAPGTVPPSSPHQVTNVAPLPVVAHAYGIAAGSSLTSLDSQALDKRLAGIVATGAQWIRFDFDWSLIQPDNSSTYRWATYDNLVASAERYHLHILGILTYTPGWARPKDCSDSSQCAPAHAAQFASFAAAVAKRYESKGLHYWEIWNEPNNPQFWRPTPTVSGYADLLKAADLSLKRADPQAFVITAGLSPQATTGTSYAPVDFLTGIYNAGGKGYFDAVGDHPYTFPLRPTSNADHAWNQMAAAKNSLRAVMVANGDQNKKIWITEFGAPTGGPGPVATTSQSNLDQHPYVVDENLQAKILGDAITLYRSYNWVGPFFVYSYQDDGTDPSTNENFFGLRRHDTSAKPAYAVFQRAATQQ